jgi:hypothetical protein
LSYITIENEHFFPDRFYLNAPTGLSYFAASNGASTSRTKKERLCQCQIQQLFDRAKLIESLDLKAAIIGTYSLDPKTLVREFPKLFDGHHQSQVPTLVLHGVKDLERIFRGEKWVPGEEHSKERDLQTEDGELRELFQVFQREAQGQKDGREGHKLKVEQATSRESRKGDVNKTKGPIEVVEIIDDDDDDDDIIVDNNKIPKYRVSQQKLVCKEHKKKDIAHLAKLHKKKLFRIPSKNKSLYTKYPCQKKGNNNQQSSTPNSCKRMRTDTTMSKRNDSFGEHVYFSKVQTQFLPPGKFHPPDIENYNPNRKGCMHNIHHHEYDHNNIIEIVDSDSESGSDIEQEKSNYAFGIRPDVVMCRQNMQGVYHPKYMLLFEKSGSIVVVVSSANMTSQKSVDASWIQRFQPSGNDELPDTTVNELRDRCDGSDFGHVLADFLQKQSEAVKEGEILPIQFLRKYVGKFDTFEDFRKCWRFDCARVHLVSTVPGYYPGRFASKHLAPLPNGSRRILYGPQRVADILHRLSPSTGSGRKSSESSFRRERSDKEEERKGWLPRDVLSDKDRLIIQTTSFGSKWTSRHLEELARQYMGHDGPVSKTEDGKSLIDKVDIIWPSMSYLEMISTMDKELSSKDEGFHHFLFLHSEGFNSSDLAVCSQMRLFENCCPSPLLIQLTPHIKTYTRLLDDPCGSFRGCHRLAWTMLSSACFSRGAQGYSLKDNNNGLKSPEDTRAYSNFELGILFVSRLEGNPETDRIYVSYPAPCRCCSTHREDQGLDEHTKFANVTEIPIPFPFRLKSRPYQFDLEDAIFCETPFFEKMTKSSISSGFCSLTPFGQWCSTRFSTLSSVREK